MLTVVEPVEARPEDVDLDVWAVMVTVKASLEQCGVPVDHVAPAIGTGYETYVTVHIPITNIQLHKIARKLSSCFCEDFDTISILKASDGYLVTLCTVTG